MQTNQAGLDLIKMFEGLRLEAYVDAVGIWTIGYGHTKGVRAGMVITEEKAEQFLREDLADAEGAVSRLVKVPVNGNEFSALASLVFNIGSGNFQRSTVLRRLNAEDRVGAADAIEWWNKGRVNGVLTVLPGLVRRRAAEKALFLTPTPQELLTDLIVNATSDDDRGVVESPPASEPQGGGSDQGLESRVTPVEGSRDRRDNLSSSRTMQGAGVAGAAGASAVGAGTTMNSEQPTSMGRTIKDYLIEYQSEILIAIGVVILLAALYIMIARWDDWRKGKR